MHEVFIVIVLHCGMSVIFLWQISYLGSGTALLRFRNTEDIGLLQQPL